MELDIEYRDVAEKLGVPGYFRAPAQNSDPGFIEALADLVVGSRRQGTNLCSFAGDRACPAAHTDCPMRPNVDASVEGTLAPVFAEDTMPNRARAARIMVPPSTPLPA